MDNNKLLLVLGITLFLIPFLSNNVLGDINITSCQELNQSGETYYLTQDINVNSSPCFNIIANNIILDCGGHLINGSFNNIISINRGDYTTTNITVKNCNMINVGYGIYTNYADFNYFYNITINNSNSYCLFFNYGHNITVNNLLIQNCDLEALYITRVYDSYFENITLINGYKGLQVAYSNNNIFDTFVIKECKSPYAFLVSGVNSFYNKFFNGLINCSSHITGGTNYWNTTKQNGTRIYSNGNLIGGNYWTNPSGTGYSDICNDTNYDGFCDEPYDVEHKDNNCNDTNSCDYLPLTLIKLKIFINNPKTDVYSPTNFILSGTTTLESNISYSLDNGTNQTLCNNCTEFSTQVYSPKGEHTICVYAITTDGSETDSECVTYTSANTVLQEYPISIAILLGFIFSILAYAFRGTLIGEPVSLIEIMIALVVIIVIIISLLFGTFNTPLFV